MPETYNSDGVECPYCGYVNDDMEQVADQDLETIDCPKCERKMNVCASISWTFEAYERTAEVIQKDIERERANGQRIIDWNPEKKFEKNPYQHKIDDLEKELAELKERV